MHRVGKIIDNTNRNQWRWVPTKENVADLATKFFKTPDTSRWNKGPQFLRQPEAEWSCQEVDFTSSISTAQSVLRKHVFLVTELDHFNFAAYYFFNLKRVQGRADRLNPEEDAIVLPKN